jgi:hypothetical protein
LFGCSLRRQARNRGIPRYRRSKARPRAPKKRLVPIVREPLVILYDLCIECGVRPTNAIRKRFRRAGMVAKKGAGLMSGGWTCTWEPNDPDLARVRQRIRELADR